MRLLGSSAARVTRFFILGAAVVGCVGGSKGLTSDDKERLKANILDAVPADIPQKIDVNYENKIHLVGFRASPEVAKPGTEVKLTYWWRVDAPVDEGWSLFTHFHDTQQDRPVGNADWVGPLREKRGDRQLLGPDRWEKGKVYVDEQTWTVPADTKAPEINVMIGIWKGDARLRVVSGPNDGENRAIAGKIKTGLTMPKEEKHTNLPLLIVPKLAQNEKIVVDGKADEKGWGGAASTGPFVDVSTGGPNSSFPVNGAARVTFDDENVYFFFDVKSPDVTGGFTDPKANPADFTATGQPKLWTKETVELMIDPDGDGDAVDYYELQINPQNKVFHSQFDRKQQPHGGDNGPFGHEDWNPKLKSAVVVQGTLDKPGDKDEGYTVEVAIPWVSFGKASVRPPQPGSSWRVNLYAMENNGGVSWSPLLGKGNFHTAERFGRMQWGQAPQDLAAAVQDGGAQAGKPAGDAGTSTIQALKARAIAPVVIPKPVQ